MLEHIVMGCCEDGLWSTGVGESSYQRCFPSWSLKISKFSGKSLNTGNESISIPSMLDSWAE